MSCTVARTRKHGPKSNCCCCRRPCCWRRCAMRDGLRRRLETGSTTTAWSYGWGRRYMEVGHPPIGKSSFISLASAWPTARYSRVTASRNACRRYGAGSGTTRVCCWWIGGMRDWSRIRCGGIRSGRRSPAGADACHQSSQVRQPRHARSTLELSGNLRVAGRTAASRCLAAGNDRNGAG